MKKSSKTLKKGRYGIPTKVNRLWGKQCNDGLLRIGSKHPKIIKGANHAFTDPEKLNEVLALSLNWFKKYLFKKEV